jgi:Putative  PD-(D/E)XK family member, (DUF4420)
MDSIYKIFTKLREQSLNGTNDFNVSSIPLVKHHKIGVSPTGQPMFFIRCEDSSNSKSIDCNLEFISVQYNRECQLFLNQSNIEEGIYTVISLKIDSIDFQEYFLEIVLLVIKNISSTTNHKELKIEVEKLISLFAKFSKPPTKTIQGLWAELLVIEQSYNIDYLAKSWHVLISDKFDFNDGIDKLEVKSTAKSKRIHSFSIEQLNPNKNSKLIVASIFTIETGIGKNIFDLISLIEKKLNDKNLFLRINETVVQTLGKDFEKSFEIYFDYQYAIDSIQYYNSENIPTISISSIPDVISNIRFDCDLTNIEYITDTKVNSTLHKALFQK